MSIGHKNMILLFLSLYAMYRTMQGQRASRSKISFNAEARLSINQREGSGDTRVIGRYSVLIAQCRGKAVAGGKRRAGTVNG